MKCQFPEYEESFIKEFTGFYPDQIIEEQNEDLENLHSELFCTIVPQNVQQAIFSLPLDFTLLSVLPA